MRTWSAMIPMRAIITVVGMLSATGVWGTNVAKEQRSAIVVNQLVLREQYALLKQQNEAMRLITDELTQKESHLQDISQALKDLGQDVKIISGSLIQILANPSFTLGNPLEKLAEELKEALEKEPPTCPPQEEHVCECPVIKDCTTTKGVIANGETWDSGCSSYRCDNGSSTLISSNSGGFTEIDGHCYLPVDSKKNWNAALQHCQSLGNAVFAKPPSNLAAFQELLKQKLSGGSQWVWLGGKSRSVGGQAFYYVSDGSSVNAQFWGSGQPGNDGDCLCIYTSGSKPLGDWYCGTKYLNFVCERL